MRQVTTAAIASPATALDPEVVEFRSQFDKTSPLDELVRTGAQRLLQSAIEAEVEEFIAVHGNRRDADGNRLLVRNRHQPAVWRLSSHAFVTIAPRKKVAFASRRRSCRRISGGASRSPN